MRWSSIIRSCGSWVRLRVARVGVGLAAVAFVVGVTAGGGWSLVASSTASASPAGSIAQQLTRVTACEVFTLAEAKTLIGPGATADPSDSHAVDFDGQRNTQCAYASGGSGLAVLQALIPLRRQGARAIRTAFANDKVTFRGTSVHGIGSAAFWKSKVGAPALYVLTKRDVMFNLGATTNGTNSAHRAPARAGRPRDRQSAWRLERCGRLTGQRPANSTAEAAGTTAPDRLLPLCAG